VNAQTNPFLRGYTQFNIGRILLVTSNEDVRMRYRPVHFLQAQIPDSQLECAFCHYGSDFALVPERQPLPSELIAQCPHTGFVLKAFHSITASQAGELAHIGDVYSGQEAQEIVRQLQFDTGHYSRCWEISTRHLPRPSLRWLEDCADAPPSTNVLFYAFYIPGTRGALGVVLHATPWTNEHLSTAVGIDASMLRASQELAGMPLQLIHVLQQAALADARIVIFDPDAPVLNGLPLQD
jgi:hypothetical protein